MKKTHYFFIVFLLLGFVCEGHAATEKAPDNAVNSSPTLPEMARPAHSNFSAPNTSLIHDLCPPVESLVKDEKTQNWSAKGEWRTNSPSFLHTVDKFVGAQWVGVSVGEVLCIYTKTTRSAFPVMLQRGKLVPAPLRGGLWSADKGGYMECKSSDVHDCPFLTQVPLKEKNVYEELDFYKGKPVEDTN